MEQLQDEVYQKDILARQPSLIDVLKGISETIGISDRGEGSLTIENILPLAL